MNTAIGTTIAIFVFIIVVLGGCVGYPQYRIYEQRLTGEAELQRAESSRRIAVLEAQAKLDSAKMLAGAEVERARGVAEANKIIGESLQGNEAYLRYLWVQQLDGANQTVVYIPTEGNMPVLEAGRTVSK